MEVSRRTHYSGERVICALFFFKKVAFFFPTAFFFDM
jgi:hypothetical protein